VTPVLPSQHAGFLIDRCSSTEKRQKIATPGTAAYIKASGENSKLTGIAEITKFSGQSKSTGVTRPDESPARAMPLDN